MHKNTLIAVATAAAIAGQAHADLLIPNSSNDTIGLYSSVDGSLIDANFIVDANDAATYDFGTPKEAIQVGDEIFVSDQIRDAIFIFDLGGNYVDKIDTGLDNVRGLAYEASNNTVYIANGGGNNGAPDDTIVTIDPTSRTITGSFGFGPPDFSPFDVAVVDDRLLVTDIDGGPSSNPFNTEGVDVFNFDGTYVGRLVSVGTTDADNGPDFPQQVSGKLSDSNILVAGFSTPAAVYEFENDGDFVATYADDFGQRGVYELLNGNYIYTGGGPDGQGAYSVDPTTGGLTFLGEGNQYIAPVVIPEPATAGLLAVGALGLLRRRQ
jgi:hypothetical protein